MQLPQAMLSLSSCLHQFTGSIVSQELCNAYESGIRAALGLSKLLQMMKHVMQSTAWHDGRSRTSTQSWECSICRYEHALRPALYSIERAARTQSTSSRDVPGALSTLQRMADEEATQAAQEDVKPDIKPEAQHLTLTVVNQVSLGVPSVRPMHK